MHMTLVSVLILLVVAGVCGGIGQAIASRSRGGFLTSIAVGFIGALLGAWIAGAAKLPELYVLKIDGEHFPIVWSIIGAALFVAAIGLFSRRRRMFA
jgi:LPXTG-motif cell wall-anchored protein